MGIALFWLLAVYLVGMSSRSIIPSLYFPELAPRPKATGTLVCLAELDALERELSDRSAQSLLQRDVESSQRWLGEWDRRIDALRGQCGPLEATRKQLAAARAVMGSMLDRYAQDAAPAQRKTRAALDAFAHVQSPPPNG